MFVIQQHGAVELAMLAVENLDANITTAVREKLEPLLKEKTLLLDLSTVEFLDSAGLTLICNLQRSAPEGHFHLAGITVRVGIILKRVPPHRLPPIHASRVEALRMLKVPTVAKPKLGLAAVI